MASASDRTPSWFTSALAHIAWQSASDAAKAGNTAQAVAAKVTAASSFLMFAPPLRTGRLLASPPVARQQIRGRKVPDNAWRHCNFGVVFPFARHISGALRRWTDQFQI